MPSERDLCFAAAVEAYNALHEEIHGSEWLDISHQMTWKRDVAATGSKWFPVTGLSSRVSSYLKSKLGSSSYQVRYPDMSIKMPDGKYMVLDNKFSGDRWGTKRGKNSGKNQRQDYEDINRDQGHPMADPKLDPQKCMCDERKKKKELKPQEVWVPVYSPAVDPKLYLVPSPLAPGVSPGTVPSPVIRPVFPSFPELVPIPF